MRQHAAENNIPAPPGTVGDLAQMRRSLTFYPEQFVKIILPAMQATGSGAAGVIDEEGSLVGLLTERDILRRIFATLKDPTISPHNVSKHIDDMTVGEAMIASPETLDEDIAIEDALGMMARRGFRYMPVVSRHDRGQLLGIVDERELAIHVQNHLRQARQSEAQSRSLLSCLLHEPYGSGYQTI